jgi:hypothetical protein
MHRLVGSLLIFACLLAGCKMNEKAYQTTYQRFKQKEKSTWDDRANTVVQANEETLIRRHTGTSEKMEVVDLVKGKPELLSTYNVVIKSFINQTNAASLYQRMLKAGYPAALVKNKEMMYHIIIGSSSNKAQADTLLEKVKSDWPDAWILVRY